MPHTPRYSLVPKPAVLKEEPGAFTLTPETGIVAAPAFERAADWLRSALGPATSCLLQSERATISFAHASDLASEAYRLAVREDSILIEASAHAGAFYAAQTLRQLFAPEAYRAADISRSGEHTWTAPAVTIEDAPRFPWRGVIIDVARHFFPKADLLRYIDLMAMHKLNVLHLHLTDDQGWRVEIKRYPRLTDIGAWRERTMVGNPLRSHFTHDNRPHGGYYTQEDLREIVAYAADRNVTVIPEIDVPGHSQAAIAAYPELGVRGIPLPVQTTWGVCENILNAEESTIEFYRNVFDEVLEIFPSEYICVGGDECPKVQWCEDERTQQLIRERGLKDEDELQSWFIRRFDAYLTERGRKLFGWDEILEGGLAEGATVASWRGMEGAVSAAELGHNVVTCPMNETYFDFPESDGPDEPSAIGKPLPLEAAYAFEPVPAGLTGKQAAHVLGAQAGLWTEHVDTVRNLDYQAFPRLSAFSESVWSPAARDFAEFTTRLRAHLQRLDALGVEYRRAAGPRPWQTRPDRHTAATRR